MDPKADSIARAAVAYAARLQGVLADDVIKSIALGQITKWAVQQDESVSRARIGLVVAEAGDYIVQHFALLESL